MMQKRKIYVLAGLLLCSVSAFAQSEKKSIAADRKNQATLPVGPVLPGEEKLSAQERAERDFLMPTRRKKSTVATTKVEEAQQAAIEVTARNLEAAEAATAEEMVAPAAKAAAPRTYHRTSHRRTSSSSHRTSSHSTKRKTTSKSSTSKSKRVTKKPATKRRR